MHIAMVAAEAYPFMKVGGLADVIGSLPQALVKMGAQVTVLVPWYEGVEASSAGTVGFTFDGEAEDARLGSHVRGGVSFIFVDTPGDFSRQSAYGYDDDERRFVRFGLAAFEVVKSLENVHVLHLHDWQAGLLAALAIDVMPVVFTIHNLAYQGVMSPEQLFDWTGLPRELHSIDGTEFHGEASLLKAGLAFADRITTVSPTYAQEIQTTEFGCALDGFLRHRSDVLSGILNGIDEQTWTPTFSGVAGKLAASKKPVLGIVTRFAHQKGIDVAAAAASDLLERGYELDVLGSGDPVLEELWHMLARDDRVRYTAAYDEPLSRQIYERSQALLIPSRYEPCGLTQMIAMRYGTIPIATSVGGLKDSIRDGETGFLFDALTPESLIGAVDRFGRASRQDLVANVLREDHSWARAAKQYLELATDVARVHELNSRALREDESSE